MQAQFRELGKVIITQVQPSGLIYETPGGDLFDPSGRLVVSQLYLSTRGVEARTGAGERILDIHHLDHPDTQGDGKNAISIGFTSHYNQMRARFGDHMQDGTAGENVIINCDEDIWLADLGKQLEFQNPGSGKTVTLDVIKIAAPCDEFSHFAAASQEQRLPAEELKETLQFLGNGRRGFLLTLSTGQDMGIIQPGDLVFSSA